MNKKALAIIVGTIIGCTVVIAATCIITINKLLKDIPKNITKAAVTTVIDKNKEVEAPIESTPEIKEPIEKVEPQKEEVKEESIQDTTFTKHDAVIDIKNRMEEISLDMAWSYGTETYYEAVDSVLNVLWGYMKQFEPEETNSILQEQRDWIKSKDNKDLEEKCRMTEDRVTDLLYNVFAN